VNEEYLLSALDGVDMDSLPGRVSVFFQQYYRQIYDIWCGSRSPDPYLWLMDPDPDPIPCPTSFFSDFKNANNFFSYFFLITYPQEQYLQP
jgi:hypothetical protein